jgi:hypothetical protein
MKKTKVFTLVITIVATTCGYTRADDVPGPDWMPQDRVARQLSAADYSAITGLEADDGFWKGKAVHNGRIIKFRADPKTGEIRSEKPEDGRT